MKILSFSKLNIRKIKSCPQKATICRLNKGFFVDGHIYPGESDASRIKGKNPLFSSVYR